MKITVKAKDNPNYTVISDAGTLTIEKATPEEPTHVTHQDGTDKSSESDLPTETDKTSDETSQTGDSFNITLWMMILLTSGAICIILLNLRKRQA